MMSLVPIMTRWNRNEDQKGNNMACNHPLVRIVYNTQVMTKTGKLTDKAIIIGEYDQTRSLESYKKTSDKLIKEVQLIPCGKCLACRLNYSKQWATRCTLEAKEWENNWFITLTYDDDHLPEDGNLHPEDHTRFMKELRTAWKRKYNHENIRFMMCGEYGSTTYRPHMHYIMFNLPIHDLVYHGSTKHHKAFYSSEEINKIWGKGTIIDIQEFSWSAAAYVARYCTKKINGNMAKFAYEEGKITPEFIRMSRKPGIGVHYLLEHAPEIYETDSIPMKNYSGHIAGSKIPKAFDRKIEEYYPEFMEEIKNYRKWIAENEEKLNQTKTTNDMKKQMLINEKKLADKANTLKREL